MRGLRLGLGMDRSRGASSDLAAPILAESYFLNGLAESVSTPATNATHVWNQNDWSSGQRRRVPFVIGSQTFLGDLIEPSRQNLFLNSNAPATQNVTVGTGFNVISVFGSGSCVVSAGTATATGYGTATPGSPVRINVSVAGTIVCTISGSPAFVNVEAGPAGSTPIVTAGSPVTRGADHLGVSLATLPGGGLSQSAHSLFVLVMPYSWSDLTAGYRLYRSANGKCVTSRANATLLDFVRYDGVGAAEYARVTHGLSPRTLRSFAVVNGASAISAFINGSASGTDDTTLTPPYEAEAGPMYIGSNVTSAEHVLGAVAVWYWPRALTAQEIATLHNAASLAQPNY